MTSHVAGSFSGIASKSISRGFGHGVAPSGAMLLFSSASFASF
jgi:hypothetical protein